MEKKRAADKGDRKFVAYPGPCNAHSCVGENACKPYDNGANHTCVCTHDSQPPYPDGTCPRKVVASVDESSGRIPVQPIASHENHMSLNNTPKPHLATLMEDKSTAVASNPDLNQHLVYVSVVSVIAFLLLISTLFFIYVNRRRRKRRENSSPLGLKQNFLIPERYAPNPQYTSCPATTIPILKKETLSFHKEVGEGCFGKVFKGELHCDDDQTRVVAIKVLKDTANKEAEEDFLREVEIMSAFKHSNILSLLGVVLKDDNVNPMMVFEFMPLGDLAELLRAQTQSKPNADLPELGRSELLSTALQIARGMEYLASQRFVHRDLACRNCLVGEELVVKIADFGMSRDVYTCDYYKIGGSRLLPIRWMSPESIHYGRFTLESDVWSYGVVLWEIFSYGKQPYYGHSNEEVLHFILADVSLEQPCGCLNSIYALMKRCWLVEPRSRITFALICEWLEEEISRDFPRGKCGKKDTRSLPRPPPLVVPGGDLLDSEGYLKPVDKDFVTYLDPMV